MLPRVVLVAVLLACSVSYGQPPRSDATQAVESARDWLLQQLDQYGKCVHEYPRDHPRLLYGGRTALVTYALLTSGLDRNHQSVNGSLQWLSEAELDGVYPVAMRATAMSAVGGNEYLEQLAHDVNWLIDAAAEDGTYTYAPCDGETCERYDNASAHAAMMAVAAGAARGVDVPRKYWRTMQRHWESQQQGDGGFGYRVPPGSVRTQSYGSMTAAGLAAAGVCFDKLHRERFVRCREVEQPRLMTASRQWLARRFDAEVNPGKGVEWYYYWLYSVAEAGRRTGRKRFGDHDWYAEGAAALLDRQRGDGSFGIGDRVEETALALIFLSAGRAPAVVNKLRYTGGWNPRPHDAANLSRWLSRTFERPMNWQLVSADNPLEDISDAPILYVSGSGAAQFSPEQCRKLRYYVLSGGLIVSESACNSGDFTLDMRRLFERLFPEYPHQRLADDHPAYDIQYRFDQPHPLEGVSNGVRLLAVHAPTELSLGLQLGESDETRGDFEQLANIFLLATGGGQLDASTPPEAEEPPELVDPVATIRVARIRHDANCDPEPAAWQRLANIMARRHGIRLVVSDLLDPAKLDAEDWPIAAMTGTEELMLSDLQRVALHDYVSRGGTLIIDAAGGSRAFAQSIREQVLPAIGGSRPGRWVPLAGPEDLSEIRYRPDYARTLGENRDQPRLLAVTREQRLAVVFSPEDITAGLVGYRYSGIRGYAPETAVSLMTNILCHIAGVQP
ncbi:MAG: DUF4159 domain-containing protein [Planctomycetota bacterium]